MGKRPAESERPCVIYGGRTCKRMDAEGRARGEAGVAIGEASLVGRNESCRLTSAPARKEM